MISQSTKQEVFDRDEGMCQGCSTQQNLERTPHHCLFKSQYFGKDRDRAWNLVIVCRDCHREVHFTGTVKGRKLREKFEKMARERQSA